MIWQQVLSCAREVLIGSSCEDAILESELLLRHVLKIDRVQLYLNLNEELTAEEEKTFWHLVERRQNGEPTAYIIGHREFYGLDFCVDNSTLIPRPESELLVDKALELVQNDASFAIAEIGTGCGAIAVSLALNLEYPEIYATDISPQALEIARSNCRKHGMAGKIQLIQGDLLNCLPDPVNLIVANLPYVEESEITALRMADFEPLLALNGGADGLEKIHQLCCEIKDKLLPGGHLLLEIGQGQRGSVTNFMYNLFPSAEIDIAPDLAGIDRVVDFTLPSGVF